SKWPNGQYCGLASYGPNAGTSANLGSAGWPIDGVIYPPDLKVRMSTRLIDITDGTSQTLLFGERCNYDAAYQRINGTSFAIIGNGWYGKNPNQGNLLWVRPGVPVNYRLPDTGGSVIDREYAYGSNHPGGANVAFVDGSVHFLSNSTGLDVLQYLSMRSDGTPIDGDSY